MSSPALPEHLEHPGPGTEPSLELSYRAIDNGLHYDSLEEGAEQLSEYQPGGNHPAHIEDFLGDQYRSCLDRFEINGPNGTHQCLVHPAAGPSVKDVPLVVENSSKTLRSLCYQAAEAMAVLHRHDICHGDFLPHNILLRLHSLDGMEETQLVEEELSWVPESNTDQVEWHEENGGLATDKIFVNTLGQAFDSSNPPAHGPCIPLAYSAPELVLENRAGKASDIWTLAATIFRICVGRKLFSAIDEEAYELLEYMVEILGPFPEPLRSAWKVHPLRFRDEPDANGNAVPTKEHENRWAVQSSGKPSLRKALNGHVYHCPQRVILRYRKIPEAEKDVFEDLIRMMCRYVPDERPSIEHVLQHPWFSFENTEAELESESESDQEMQ
ncbi:kinase-like domain-containing protein [Aspergillus californicus]